MKSPSKPTTIPAFNPSGIRHVDVIKQETERVMSYLEDLRSSGIADPRCVALAQTNYEQAAMWAVKSLFVSGE